MWVFHFVTLLNLFYITEQENKESRKLKTLISIVFYNAGHCIKCYWHREAVPVTEQPVKMRWSSHALSDQHPINHRYVNLLSTALPVFWAELSFTFMPRPYRPTVTLHNELNMRSHKCVTVQTRQIKQWVWQLSAIILCNRGQSLNPHLCSVLTAQRLHISISSFSIFQTLCFLYMLISLALKKKSNVRYLFIQECHKGIG